MALTPDLVVGIDSSTSATKAIAWQADGAMVAAGRSPIPLASPGPNRYEQDRKSQSATARARARRWHRHHHHTH